MCEVLSPSSHTSIRNLHMNTPPCRILAFSPHQIVSVEVWLDGKLMSMATPVNGGPLFVLPWEPAQYLEGEHTIYVNVKVSSLLIGWCICVRGVAYAGQCRTGEQCFPNILSVR